MSLAKITNRKKDVYLNYYDYIYIHCVIQKPVLTKMCYSNYEF
jgi:hypothetical protein